MAFRSQPKRLDSFSLICRESNIDDVDFVKLRAPLFSFFDYLNYFFFQSFAFLRRKSWRSDVTIISGSPSTLSPDIVLSNFSHREYFRQVVSSPDVDVRESVKLLRVLWFSLFEGMLLRFGGAKMFLCNSPGLTEEVRSRCPDGVQVEYLPNVFNRERFSPKERIRLRENARQEFSFSGDEFVFSFMSFGHHLRKGFFCAVRAISLVNQRLAGEGKTKVKFLVIGGERSTIRRLKRKISKIDPDFEDWLVFSGSCTEPENVLSASDAFIFPSYFDSTPNAVIEAAGLGLPLFLTNFYGSEVLLQENVNGRRISHDENEIADVILSYLDSEEREACGELNFELHTEESWSNEFFGYLDSVKLSNEVG